MPRSISATASQPTFAAVVDDYLERFGHYHPAIAAGNGLHTHDAELEDFSAASIEAELEWLHRERARLEGLDRGSLTADELVDRRILQGIIDGWILDLATVRNWTRNPMIYIAAISDGMHDLITLESASPRARMQHALAKLGAVPRLLTAARTNVVNPPKVFVAHAIGMLGGLQQLLSHDLPLAFDTARDEPVHAQLLAAARATQVTVAEYQRYLETRVLPTADGKFAVGAAAVEARYRAEELIDLPVGQLLTIGYRELALKKAEFAEVAARVDPHRSSSDVWRGVQDDHPARGQVVPAARRVVGELFAYIGAHHLVTLPPDQHIEVAAAPAYDLGLASMHSSPPLEPHPLQSYYYITDASADWSITRQNDWLRAFNYASLADISAHEVAPGHYVHSMFMRHTSGKVRRIWIGLNPFPQPSSGQDGWAHYAEQMISDEGFKGDDARYRLAMVDESLIRICRLIAGIKLHDDTWTIAQAEEFFAREALLPASSAQREAERGTYDPTYGGYFLGKMAVLKLRRDYAAAQGAAFNLREFHERVMTNGIAPWWAHRELLLPGNHGAVID